ncbi:MAG: PorT family protein [Muribaculaceae bacterium]|nr:PorT family protein [Muribaculaceae bacterium]
MKRTISTFVSAFVLCLAAFGQEVEILPSEDITPAKPPRWGVRLQADITTPTNGLDLYSTGTGISGGIVYNLPLYRGLYVEPGVMLYYNTIDVDDYMVNNLPYDGSARLLGIRLPVNIGYRFNLTESISLSLFTGPGFNFNISARQYANPNFEGAPPKTSKNLFDYGWHRFDAQWGFGITATFSGRYVIGLSAGVGSKALAEKTIDGHKAKMNRNTFSVTLGYNF